jgi:hypothetical protein
VRTLSSFSRAFVAAAAIAAAALIVGGAFFVGYVSELQRGLNDPAATGGEAARHIATIEQALGYGGFLKAYRDSRLSDDPKVRDDLTRHTIDAAHALDALRKLYATDKTAEPALREAANIGATFVNIAQSAPESALRGSHEALPQLEAAYQSLRSTLDRLRVAEQDRELGGAAHALNWSQALVIAAVATLVIGLIIVAALLHLGIIQPLKSLEHSLTAMGEGALNQHVWGHDRHDEFGSVARAGEKLRRNLTETTALRSLAERGQLHLSLDGQASVLLQRLASDVTAATQALKLAAADFAKLQDGSRQQLGTALAGLNATTAGVAATAETLQRNAAAAIDEIRTSTGAINEAASHRAHRLDKIANRLDNNTRKIDETVSGLVARTVSATEEVTASATSLRAAADATVQVQQALTASFDKIEVESGKTATSVRTLAARLSDTIGLVDERLSRRLAALDALEQTVAANLAALREKAEATSEALARTAEMAAAPGELPTAPPPSQNNELTAAIARLDEIAQRLSNPRREAAPAPDVHALADALQSQLETVRSEIRDLAVRMTEERILATGSGGLSSLLEDTLPLASQTPQRTLADVPNEEIMARLKDLAAEMNATEAPQDETAPLKEALGAFAADVKTLAASADRVAKLKAMGRALDQHADEIEAHAPAVEPSSALRTELQSITGELRMIAALAQANVVKDGPRLREAAVEVGARAESLFTYLSQTHAGASASNAEPIDDASDLDALTSLISRIEARAGHDEGSLNTNTAIHAVFESIGRLNNIANALGRAGNADRRRPSTH